MDVLSLIPRHGKDTLRIGDSNELVVMENFGSLPKGKLVLENHGLAVFCTEGMAQFDYDGRTIQLRKNGLFLYMAHSIAEKFMASVDFNCRQLWFSQSEMYDMNIHSNTGLPDLVFLKNNPMVSLNEAQADLLDSHFCLLCRIMRDSDVPLYVDIVRSLAGTLMLKILSLLRGNSDSEATTSENSTSFHGRQLADRSGLRQPQQCTDERRWNDLRALRHLQPFRYRAEIRCHAAGLPAWCLHQQREPLHQPVHPGQRVESRELRL